MQQPTIQELRTLMESTQAPCVSLYMPAHPGVAQNQQDRTRFKNLLRDAEKGLENSGLRAPEIKEFLDPAVKLGSDGLFWRKQNHGLALFRSSEQFHHYQLPFQVDELVMVTNRFHLKPLMQLVSQRQFYLLALSLKGTRLLRGTEHGLSALPEEAPMTMEEFLEGEERETHLQYHTFSTGSRGRQMASYHGHGGGNEDSKEDVRRYCRYIEGLISQHLAGENLPLILAGVEYLLPIYRETNTYPHLAEVSVEGNPDEFGTTELHQRVWSAMEPQLMQEQEEAMEQFNALLGTGKASIDLAQVAMAAHQGRVEVLFVPLGIQKPGLVNAQEQTVELIADSKRGQYPDLLDQAAIATFSKGGTVYVVESQEMPHSSELAAIFRY